VIFSFQWCTIINSAVNFHGLRYALCAFNVFWLCVTEMWSRLIFTAQLFSFLLTAMFIWCRMHRYRDCGSLWTLAFYVYVIYLCVSLLRLWTVESIIYAECWSLKCLSCTVFHASANRILTLEGPWIWNLKFACLDFLWIQTYESCSRPNYFFRIVNSLEEKRQKP